MEPLTIKGKEDTPDVYLDMDKGLLRISGNSFCDDPKSIYQKILDWIDEYKRSPRNETNVEFRMNYINTALLKYL